MYAKTEDSLKEAKENMIREREKYPKFVKRFEAFFNRKEEWVLFFRQKLLTRGNNTNNYAEVTIRILKDVVLRRTKAFNVVALTDFCVSAWEPHLVKKLLEYAHSRRGEVKLLYKNFLHKTESFTVDDIKEVEENTFSVSNRLKTQTYIVNTDVGVCSCPSGISGAFCKHQFFIMKTKNIQFYNAPPISSTEKYQLAVLALGSKCPPPNFFDNFIDDDTSSPSNYLNNLDLNSEDYVPRNNADIALASQEDKDLIKKEIYRLTKLLDNEEMTKTSSNKLLQNLKQVQKINDFDKLYFFKSKVQKKIKVQPTSIARRRPEITKSGLRIPSGRPPMKLQNRGIKRKRCLKENVEKNQSNAKSHGLNH